MKSNKITNILKYALSATLMAALLYFAFRSVEWNNFVDGVQSTDFTFVLMSMCCGFSAFVLRALRWKLLMQPLDPDIRFSRVFDGVCIGNLANCALPFAGEIARCGVVSTKRAGIDKTLGTIALERLWDLISIILIVILAFALKGGAVSGFLEENVFTPIAQNAAKTWWIALLVIVALVVAIWAVIRLRSHSKLLQKAYDAIKGLGQGFISFAKMKKKGLFLILTLLIWTMYWLMCVCISHGFPAANGLAISDTLFIMAVGNLASVIPVPGGFGAYHYIVALALSGIYGLSWDNGIVFATLSHESQAIVMIVSGIICYVHRTLAMQKK